MKKINELITNIGGKEIQFNNIIKPTNLYLLPNNIWLSINTKNGTIEIKLGNLYLYNNLIPELIIPASFEWYLATAKNNSIDVNYSIEYNILSKEDIINTLLTNLKIILDNYKELSLLLNDKVLEETTKFNNNLKDISNLSIDEIQLEIDKLDYNEDTNMTIHLKQLYEESEAIKKNHNLPDYIYTAYDYYKLHEIKHLTIKKLISSTIFVLMLVGIILGSIFHYILGNGNLFYLVFGNLQIVLLSTYFLFKRKPDKINPLAFSLFPFILLYLILYTISGLDLDLAVILTLSIGAVVVLILLTLVIIKKEKIKKASIKYYVQYNILTDELTNDNYKCTLFSSDNKHVVIFELSKNKYIITLCSDIIYEKLKLKDMLAEAKRIDGNLEKALKESINLLKNNKDKTIYK